MIIILANWVLFKKFALAFGLDFTKHYVELHFSVFDYISLIESIGLIGSLLLFRFSLDIFCCITLHCVIVMVGSINLIASLLTKQSWSKGFTFPESDIVFSCHLTAQ